MYQILGVTKMTKSEIEQNAEEYANETCKDCYISAYSECKSNCKKQSHIAGALSRQLEIDEAKKIIKRLHDCLLQDDSDEETKHYIIEYMTEAEQFLGE